MLTCSEPKNGARILATAYVPLHDKPVQASCGRRVAGPGRQAGGCAKAWLMRRCSAPLENSKQQLAVLGTVLVSPMPPVALLNPVPCCAPHPCPGHGVLGAGLVGPYDSRAVRQLCFTRATPPVLFLAALVSSAFTQLHCVHCSTWQTSVQPQPPPQLAPAQASTVRLRRQLPCTCIILLRVTSSC